MISSADYHKSLESLPLATFEAMVGDRAIVVIAPHPDDESLGCGGLLAWAANHGRRIKVIFLTDGEGSHPGSTAIPPLLLAKIRIREGRLAATHLGVVNSSLEFMHLPDGSLPTMNEETATTVAEQLRTTIEQLAPCVVFVTASTDPHGDHQRAYELAAIAVHDLVDCPLFAYPIWSWVLPEGSELPEPCGHRVDISGLREKKADAIAAHASQHGQVVRDSEAPFVLPKLLLERLNSGYEIYLDA